MVVEFDVVEEGDDGVFVDVVVGELFVECVDCGCVCVVECDEDVVFV